jgi:predicted dehydrogenase
MGKTRIAVAGAGLIGRTHIAIAAASPTVTLTAVVDPAPSAAAVAAHFGVPLFASLDELLARQPPDGMVLATPNALHVPQALQCLEAGLGVLLEKPVAPTVAEGEALVQRADALGGRLLIGHHRAHSPIMAKARAVVDSGQLGRLVSVSGSATFLKPDHYFDDGPWRRVPGGGPMLINMIHEVHNLHILCGEIVAVQAIASHAVRGFAVEDTVAITLQFASGVLGSFLLSDTAASARNWEHTSRENAAYPHYGDEDCYVLSGTNGSLAVPTLRLKTYPRPEDRSWWKPFEVGVVGLVREDPLQRQMEHFGALVRGETLPLVSARDGLQNLRVTEAIVEAARSGCTVRLDRPLSNPTFTTGKPP